MAAQMQIFTIHSRGRSGELLAVGDHRHPLGVLPPFWALWRGNWVTALAMCAILAATAVLHPLVFSTVFAGLAAITIFDGSSLERLELRLRGWKTVGVVEARTEEGAEELYLRGEAS